ncbi:MAG: glycine--tRNA ligase subunit beta [Alphaproteobacteria bacterium]|nr:glycine--tRNA ligase subunit beta [Alphaproteobacteria bacterium]
MAEWLLEIFSEEIPSRMQKAAQEQLKSLSEHALKKEGLSFDSIKTFITPRRLTLVVEGLPLQSPEKREEKKGPRVDAPPVAIEGFLNTAGVRREECETRETPKGTFLFTVISKPGRPTPEVLSQIAPPLLESMRWPKSMRWGDNPTLWVRPLRGLLSLFEGHLVPFSYAGIPASLSTRGHRFLAPGPFEVKNFKDYEQKLRKHFVILDWAERRALIEKGVTEVAQTAQLIPLEDEALLDEVAGLVEWPVALKGSVDAPFMELPREVITTPMRVHQRYFPLVNGEEKLAPYFAVVANMETSDQGKTIIRGNERVLRARLADAQFFWEQDQKQPLDYFNTALKARLFHQHLGSLFDKVERLTKLSSHIAKTVNADPKIVGRAALLSKADLSCLMVGEFPELQGIMGCYYAQNQGEPLEVAKAIEEHYWPKTSGGAIPEAVPSLILAMTDRIDTLVGFFAIGITPSGSKDPFALRRAGLSLIALSLNPHFTLSMLEVLAYAYDTYDWSALSPPLLKSREETITDLWQWMLERFKFALKDTQKSPYDHVDAVLAVAHDNPTFSDLSLRVKALDQLMDGEDGQNLLIAYKRASNILRIEEEKDKMVYGGNIQETSLENLEEKELFVKLSIHSLEIQDLVSKRNFVKAFQVLGTLRPTVDQFFDRVVVNTEDKRLRMNRLHLLALIRETLHQVADFSKIEG